MTDLTSPLILIAEDDPAIRRGLVDLLESENYRVEAAENGKVALQIFRRKSPQLVILDVMMPEMNGFDVCREIREQTQTVPILFLTAKTEEVDQVVGFRLGGDDYVTKPFGMQALLARVEALLRRVAPPEEKPAQQNLPEEFPFASGAINRKRYEFKRGDEFLPITARELGLIDVFFAHPREVHSREKLLHEVWGLQYFGTTRTLDQHMAQLRKKVEPNPHEPQFLLTAHGIGYSYEPPEG